MFAIRRSRNICRKRRAKCRRAARLQSGVANRVCAPRICTNCRRFPTMRASNLRCDVATACARARWAPTKYRRRPNFGHQIVTLRARAAPTHARLPHVNGTAAKSRSANELSSAADDETEPKMPPCALIMARPAVVKFGEIGRAAVGQHDTAKAAVVGLAHGGVDADLGRHAADQQRLDAAVVQHQLEIGLVERALAGLVDDRLARDRIELRNDVVARLAPHQNAAHRAPARRCATQDRRARPCAAARRRDPDDGLRACG